MTQLALLLGRPLRMSADEDGNYDDEATVYEQVDVYLSPRQATWMGGDPAVPQCPGCVLFGCCAVHDSDDDEAPVLSAQKDRNHR